MFLVIKKATLFILFGNKTPNLTNTFARYSLIHGIQFFHSFPTIIFPFNGMYVLPVFVHIAIGIECFRAVGASVEALSGVRGHMFLQETNQTRTYQNRYRDQFIRPPPLPLLFLTFNPSATLNALSHSVHLCVRSP